MSTEAQNSNQSAPAPAASDNATSGAEVTGLAPELGPNGLPINPPDGAPPATVEHDFIMDTLFGEGTAEPPANSGEGQTQGSNSSDGQSDQGSLAPPSPAPAANGGEGSPQSGPSSTQQTGQQQVSGDGAPAQTPGQVNQPSPEAQPSPQLSAEDRLRLASVEALSQQNAQLMERLRSFESGQQPQTQPQGQGQQPSAQQPGGGQEPPIRLAVPNELYAAIMDENPATSKPALDLLLSAVVQNAVQTTLQRVGPLIDQRLTAVTQTVEATRQVQTMEQAYYDAFPAHNNPLFKPLIQEVTQEKYRAFPHAPWDSDMIGAVGATVNAKLKALGIDPSNPNGGQQQPNGNGQQQPQQGQRPRQQPAPMLDGSTRAGGGVPQDAGDFISSTFS